MADSEHASRGVRLPIELVDLVISFVSSLRYEQWPLLEATSGYSRRHMSELWSDYDRWRTLKACSLVSHSWKHLAYRHLFENMCFVWYRSHRLREPGDWSYFDFLNIKVHDISDALRYLSQSRAIHMHVRRLALCINNNHEIIPRDTLVEILQPLGHLKSLLIHNIGLSPHDSNVEQLVPAPNQRPVFSSINELYIDQTAQFEAGTRSASNLPLSSFCHMFERIDHLVLSHIPMAQESQDTSRFMTCPVNAITVRSCLPDQNLYMALRTVPAHALHTLVLDQTRSEHISALSRLLAHLGPNLKHLTLGRLGGNSTSTYPQTCTSSSS
jgi:hypothetical protein